MSNGGNGVEVVFNETILVEFVMKLLTDKIIVDRSLNGLARTNDSYFYPVSNMGKMVGSIHQYFDPVLNIRTIRWNVDSVVSQDFRFKIIL